MLTVAGQFDNGVDHMLEELRSGNGTLFGNVANDDDGNIGLFGGLDEKAGAVADLARGAGGSGIIVGGDALNTIDNAEANGRWHMANGGEDGFEGGGIEELDVVTNSNLLRGICWRVIGSNKALDAGGNLGDVFFGADVEYALSSLSRGFSL